MLGVGALGLKAAPAIRKIAGNAYKSHQANAGKAAVKEILSLVNESGLKDSIKIKKSPGVGSSYSAADNMLRFPIKGGQVQAPQGTVAHELGHAVIDKDLVNPFSKVVQDSRLPLRKIAGRLGDVTGGNLKQGQRTLNNITGSVGAIAGAVMGSNPITAGIGGMIGGGITHLPTLINEADATIQGLKLMKKAGMSTKDAASMMGKAYASYVPQAIEGVSQGVRNAGIGTIGFQAAKDIKDHYQQE